MYPNDKGVFKHLLRWGEKLFWTIPINHDILFLSFTDSLLCGFVCGEQFYTIIVGETQLF